MSEFITPERTFKTLYGDEHSIGVTRNWEVVLDDVLAEQYLRPAAVVLLGFMGSLDTAVTRETFYAKVLSEYDKAVSTGESDIVVEIDNARNGTNLGGRLSTVSTSLSSPFRTNILQLPLGIKKRLLICSDPADEDFVREVIIGSVQAEDPEINRKFQNMLFEEYMTKKDFLLRNIGKRAPAQSRKLTTPVRDQRSSTRITEVSTTATRRNTQDRVVVPVISLHDNSDELIAPLFRKDYIPDGDVLKRTGAHIFAAESGQVFSTRMLSDELVIHPKNEGKIRNVLEALMRAGFVERRVVNDEIIYTRTQKQKD